MSAPTVSRVGRFLDAIPWAYTTAPCRALGFDFAVRVMDPVLGSYLDQILVPSSRSGPPQHLYSLVDRGPGVYRRFPLFFDDVRIGLLKDPGFALSYLLWHVNQEVVERTSDLLLIHASAVEHEGTGLLFPAPMESGKTTLAAGLVQAGLRYVTDEAVAIDPSSLRVQPYPKALSVDPGSWEVLAALRPQVGKDLAPYLGAQWHVRPQDIRAGAVAPACTPGFVIAPHYDRDATTSLQPMRRAEALSVLVENSFNLNRHGALGFQALARVVAGCRCYRLTVGDLSDACRLILGLLHDKEGKVAC